MSRYTIVCLIFLLLSILVACDQHPKELSVGTGNAPVRQYDRAQIERGAAIFAEHCASCHGADAAGDPQWRKRGPDGKFPPPPLNGTGHAWHHSREVLTDVIKNGSEQGQGNMPAWKDKLSEHEIESVISWFQSKWPEPVYEAWYEMQQRGR